MYIWGGSASHPIKKLYIGVNGISKKIKRGYIGDETGKARLFYSSSYRWERYNVLIYYYWGMYQVNTTNKWNQTGNTSIPVFRTSSASYPAIVFEGTQNASSDLYTANTLPSVNNNGVVSYPTGTYLCTVGSQFPQQAFDCRKISRYVYSKSNRGFSIARSRPGSDNVSGINLIPIQVRALGTAAHDHSVDENTVAFSYVDINPSSYDMTIHFINGEVVEEQSKGSLIGTVSSENISEFPQNGIFGSYYYVYKNSNTIRGSYIDTVESDNENAYPINGRSGDYWYVKIT